MNVRLAYCYPSFLFLLWDSAGPNVCRWLHPWGPGLVDKAGIWSQHEVHSPDHRQAIIYSVLPSFVGQALVDSDVFCGGTEAVGEVLTAHGSQALSAAASAWGTP